MTHWVYVLECDEDRIYVGETTKLYSRWRQHLNGNTKCTRIFEPECIIGLYNLSKNIAFINYIQDGNFNKLLKTFNIDWNDMYRNELTNLDVENYITECFMKNKGEYWWTVRGGKYTKLIEDYDTEEWNTCPDCINRDCENCIFYQSKSKEMQELGLIEKHQELSKCVNPVLKFNNDRPNCFCGYPCEINMNKSKELYYNCPLKNANNWVNFDELGLQENCNFYEKYIHVFHEISKDCVFTDSD